MHLQPLRASLPSPATTPSTFLLAAAAVGLLANYLIRPGGLIGPGFAVWIALLAAVTGWYVTVTGCASGQIAVWRIIATSASAALVLSKQ